MAFEVNTGTAAATLTGTEKLPVSQGGAARAATVQQIVDLFETISVDAELIRDTIGTTLVEGSGIDITVDDAGNTITIAATGVLSDGDKGDIVVSGAGTVFTIDTGVVTNAMIASRLSTSVFGRSANSGGVGADMQAASDHQVMRRSGTAIGFGSINLAQSAAVTGDLPFANIVQGSALSVAGVTGNATADFASIAAASDHQVLRRSGTALAFGAVNLAQSAAVTGALSMANGGTGSALTDPGADRIAFWDDSAGAVTWLTLGTNLSISTTTLNASSGSSDVFRPEDYGALGDGVTNDTAAFIAMTAAVNAAGGGAITISPVTYIIGSQTFAGAGGLGYAYLGAHIMSFLNCTKPVVIEMTGAILKWASGLKYGSFNPTTGAVHNPTLPFTDVNYQGSLGYTIIGTNCTGGLFVNGGEIDGNQADMTLGGVWGDSGRQIVHYGIVMSSTKGLIINNYVHHTCLDGYMVQHPSLTEDTGLGRPVVMINCIADYNARQGCSWVGGKGFRAINCQFTNTGKGTFSSAPGAGLDIEAESSVCRDGLFENCIFANNAGSNMVADVGDAADVTFDACQFYGTTSYSVWPNKPRFTFNDCKFSGQALANYSGTNRGDWTVFNRCIFGHQKYNNLTVHLTDLFDASVPAIFNFCQFATTNSAVRLGTSVATAEYHDCSFLQNGSTAGALVRGTFYGNTLFTVTTGSNDFTGSVNYGRITGTGSWLGWARVSTEGYGYGLPLIRSYRFGYNGSVYKIHTDRSWNDSVVAGTAFDVGDMVVNSAPVVGGIASWVNTVAGSPGTMQPVGIIGAIQAVAQADFAGADLAAVKVELNAFLAKLRTSKQIAT